VHGPDWRPDVDDPAVEQAGSHGPDGAAAARVVVHHELLLDALAVLVLGVAYVPEDGLANRIRGLLHAHVLLQHDAFTHTGRMTGCLMLARLVRVHSMCSITRYYE